MIKRKNNIIKKIKRIIKKISINLKKNKILWIIGIIIIIFFIWIKINYYKYIENENNIINTIYFDKNIMNNNTLSWMINFIQNTFLWSNSAKNKILWYKAEKEKILLKYTYLENIKISLIDNKSIKIFLQFKKPKLNFIGSWMIYWVYDENTIQDFNINNISWLNLQNTWTITLYLPNYLYWEKIESTLFFKTNLDTIISYANNIKKLFKNAKIYYLAWWESIKVETKDKIYFFSLTKDIEKQINHIKIVKNKLLWEFEKAKIIDVWNLEEWIYLKYNWLWK